MFSVREIVVKAIKESKNHLDICNCRKCTIAKLAHTLKEEEINMPTKKPINPEECTASRAIAVVKAFANMGVPVKDLVENDLVEGLIPVLDNPDFEDDGKPHQYLATFWNKQMVVSLADQVMQGPGGTYQCLIRFASMAVVNSTVAPGENAPIELTMKQAEELVFNLPGFGAKLDAALGYHIE